MKVVLFDVKNANKTQIKKIVLDNDCYMNEVCFSQSLLDAVSASPTSFVEKLRHRMYNKKIERLILKSLDNYDKKWAYILSKELKEKDKYLDIKAQQFLGCKLNSVNEMPNNVFEYINEYADRNKELNAHEFKILLVVANVKSLDFSLIEKLLRRYKNVNIYSKQSPSEYILKRIREINKSEGTTIEILKKDRKSFVEYNVIYFIDDYRENYPRFRINKTSQVIDLRTSQHDIYNSNIIYLNEFLNKHAYIVDEFEGLKTKYNLLELAGAIKKTTNILDKS